MELRAFIHVGSKGVPKSRINDGWENGKRYIKRNKADGQQRPHPRVSSVSSNRGKIEHHALHLDRNRLSSYNDVMLIHMKNYKSVVVLHVLLHLSVRQPSSVLHQHAGFLLPLENQSENSIFNLPHLKIKRLFKMQSY